MSPIQRIISFYPPHQHDEIRLSIATNLKAVICQRLVPRADGKGRIPAAEVMVNTQTVQEYMMKPEKIPMLHTVVAGDATQ